MFGKGYVSVPHLFHNMIGTCHARQFPGAAGWASLYCNLVRVSLVRASLYATILLVAIVIIIILLLQGKFA